MVTLLNSHIVLDKSVASELFGNESYVQVVFYSKHATLMMARDSDAFFQSLHQSRRSLLKEKNLRGDKSVNLREIIMDNDLDDTDRPLACRVDKAMNVLNVYFN